MAEVEASVWFSADRLINDERRIADVHLSAREKHQSSFLAARLPALAHTSAIEMIDGGPARAERMRDADVLGHVPPHGSPASRAVRAIAS
ncbi:MAG TPA: hypothetical protein VGC50_00750 [Gammaproteobacteria bacterium]|jgi:hypothetical protein